MGETEEMLTLHEADSERQVATSDPEPYDLEPSDPIAALGSVGAVLAATLKECLIPCKIRYITGKKAGMDCTPPSGWQVDARPARMAYTMGTISKTFRLQAETVAALDELVGAGLARSQTALIEVLVQRERIRLAKREREAALLAEWQDAMNDPQFVADQRDIEEAFRSADEESATYIQ